MSKTIFKRDKYSRVRGNSKLLELSCRKCGDGLFRYQKDGPGMLKRLYLDRIFGNVSMRFQLKCKCGAIIGNPSIYKKENRECFILFRDSIAKNIVK